MSAGLIYLQTSNFGIDKIPDGPVLCNSIKGFSVVLFYSPTRCQYSPAALQELKRVVGTVNGVVFAVLNIDKHMDVVRMSRNTLTSVEGVPYIMLYFNGVPKQIYPENFPFTAEAMRNFAATVSIGITKAMNNTQRQPRAGQPNQQGSPTGSRDIEQAASAPHRGGGSLGGSAKNTIYYIGSPLKRKNCTYISVDDQQVAISKSSQAQKGRQQQQSRANYPPVGNVNYR